MNENNSLLAVLTPAQSKRLIAKAVVTLPEVRKALSSGWLMVAGGTTNAFIAEELTSQNIDKIRYSAGIVDLQGLSLVPQKERLEICIFHKGQRVNIDFVEALEKFNQQDVFIKGANALDANGNIGILLGNPKGGTIGQALPIIQARGSIYIAPVGMEKLIPSVPAAAKCFWQRHQDALNEYRVGYMPVSTARVITEIEAFRILTDTSAVAVAAGGIDGAEGAVTFSLSGNTTALDKARELIRELRKEPALRRTG